MIEATLDRTLILDDPQKETSKVRVKNALQEIKMPVEFDSFITQLVDKTGAERDEIEDRFWELLDNGDIRLSADFMVKLNLA
jgi:hypothetical protein